MTREHDHGHNHSYGCGCCSSMDRRDFMATVGLSALVAPGVLGLTSALMGDVPKADQKPRVRVVFVRAKDAHAWGWPGWAFDLNEWQAGFTKTMTDAAQKHGVDLDIFADSVCDMPTVEKLLAECKQSPPDGLVVVEMCLSLNKEWPLAHRLVAERGDIPTILFSPMGTSFTPHLQRSRKVKKCFTAATKNFDWLATGIKMMRTAWDMKTDRICVINGVRTEGGWLEIDGDRVDDHRLDVVGTTLHYVPLRRWTDEWARQQTTPEVTALAEELTRTAKKIVEPKPEDIVNAAKTYFVAKRIMVAENCQGISVNCLDLIRHKLIPCPPCMAWQRLNNEGSLGYCECDWNAAISLRLCSLLTGRPGFMQDPAPDTVNGTLIGAHCTSASKLRGFDQPAEPVILRSHSESDMGVSPQVIWPVGEQVTVMKFDGPGKMILGAGRIVSNIDTPPCGGCRTSVELEMDNVADTRDCKGFHQLFILGKHDRLLRAYCDLVGIEVVPV